MRFSIRKISKADFMSIKTSGSQGIPAILVLVLIVICIVPLSCSTPTNQDPVRPGTTSIRILFLGNSHTAMHDVPGLVRMLVETGGKNRPVVVDSAIGGFLENLAGDAGVEKKIRTGNWDFVVMQGQKISMSGRFLYSTREAEDLSKLAKQSGAKVIWFAEWGRKGIAGETERTENIYRQISEVHGDIVSPVGQVWANALAKQPDLELHSADGNHSSPLGASLAALTLYSTITGADCRDLPTIDSGAFGEDVQSFLKSVVWETLDQASSASAEKGPAKIRMAIDRVLELDKKLGLDRDNFCREHSLADAIRKYVSDIRGMDFSGCPTSFQAAFASHATAWEDAIPFLERFPDLRGEMHDLFKQIRGIDAAARAELEKIEKPVWDTWAAVEKASKDKRDEE